MDKIVINPVTVTQREPVHVVQLMDHVSVKVATMGMHALMFVHMVRGEETVHRNVSVVPMATVIHTLVPVSVHLVI